MSAAAFLRDLQSRGRYSFSTEQAVRALDRSPSAVQAALRRLKAKGQLADPYRGFHVIVPPEYQRLGCLPPEQFLPDLMTFLEEPYYVALLSAAAAHGAAHQKPQVFQVIVRSQRRSIDCGRVRVQFIQRADMQSTPVEVRNTERGELRIATPAATAVELVGYAAHCGGLDNVATVLAELAGSIPTSALAEEALRAPLAWVQRLGFLLEVVEAGELAESLLPIVEARRAFPVALESSAPTKGRPSDPRWKISVNVQVEPDL